MTCQCVRPCDCRRRHQSRGTEEIAQHVNARDLATAGDTRAEAKKIAGQESLRETLRLQKETPEQKQKRLLSVSSRKNARLPAQTEQE